MYQAALVLEGGALRGQYTAGVLDVFLENNIHFQRVIGVSAGALCSVNYISEQIGRTTDINVNYRQNKEYISFRNLIRYDSIINLEFLFSNHSGSWQAFDEKTYEASKTDFTMVATALRDGKPIYFTNPRGEALKQILKASSSLPVISSPQDTDQGLCLDGGIADSIPYEYAQSQGFQKVVIIRTQDRAYRKKETTRLMVKAYEHSYKDYQAFAKTAINRPIMYNQQVEALNQLEKQGELFVIAPKAPVSVKRLEKDQEKLIALYQEGRQDALASLPKMKEYIAASH